MGAETGTGATLLAEVIRACRHRRGPVKLADATGATLSGVETLTAALLLRGRLRRILGPDERRVGILLPPSVGAAVANLALALDGRVAVNLNYTLTPAMLDACLARAEVRHVLTSRALLARLPMRLDAEFVFLDDIRRQTGAREKAAAALLAKTLPAGALLKRLGRNRVAPDEPLMVVFTSGSTGEPKGAVLTYDNVAAIIGSVAAAMRFEPTDVVLGALPFFHAFGAVLTLWAALALDVAAAYHHNPLDAAGVGVLCRRHRGTILLSTPTFLRAYQKRGAPEAFASLEAIVTGGERLTPALADAVERAFGVRPVEGYGATEASSLAASRVPANRARAGHEGREGTVGRPLPGVRARIVDPESGRELPQGEAGLLLIGGRNVMAGYLARPEATAAALRDGWLVTGDIARIDAEGNLEIAGRRSRFAKVGGEMVPLGGVEEALIACLGERDDAAPPLAAVAVADEARGERIAVIHAPLEIAPAELRRAAIAAGLPPIYAPAVADFFEIETLPLTATGKTDYGRLGQIAAERRQRTPARIAD